MLQITSLDYLISQSSIEHSFDYPKQAALKLLRNKHVTSFFIKWIKVFDQHYREEYKDVVNMLDWLLILWVDVVLILYVTIQIIQQDA